MAGETLRDRGKPHVEVVSPTRSDELTAIGSRPLLVTLWAILALTALWRLALSLQVLLAGNGALVIAQSAIILHWRQLDQFLGWIVLILWFSITGDVGKSRIRQLREIRVLTLLIAIGIALHAAAAVWDQWSPPRSESPFFWLGDHIQFGADLWLSAVAFLGVLREFRAFSRQSAAGGVSILHLWRMVCTQWILAWVLIWIGATIYVQITSPGANSMGNQGERRLFFLIPAFAIMPNVVGSPGTELEFAL